MSKAILVIDVDKKYLGKEISIIKFADNNAIYCSEELKPMPEKINPLKVDINNYLLNLGYMHGRNDLINQMEGDENE